MSLQSTGPVGALLALGGIVVLGVSVWLERRPARSARLHIVYNIQK
jgi:DHA1 family inner membrane transport protein